MFTQSNFLWNIYREAINYQEQILIQRLTPPPPHPSNETRSKKKNIPKMMMDDNDDGDDNDIIRSGRSEGRSSQVPRLP